MIAFAERLRNVQSKPHGTKFRVEDEAFAVLAWCDTREEAEAVLLAYEELPARVVHALNRAAAERRLAPNAMCVCGHPLKGHAPGNARRCFVGHRNDPATIGDCPCKRFVPAATDEPTLDVVNALSDAAAQLRAAYDAVLAHPGSLLSLATSPALKQLLKAMATLKDAITDVATGGAPR